MAPSGECLRGKDPPDRMLAKHWCLLFLAAYTLCAKPGYCCLCVVSLLPCVADCCMSYTVCKIERFVLTIMKTKIVIIKLSRLSVLASVQFV